MASLTIRNIDDSLKERLRVRAALHGHSMEEEARIILRRAVEGLTGPALLARAQSLFGGEAGVDLEAPARDADRPAPAFRE
ncbi:MAG TPA: hypothetical protein PKY87_13900 [Terricaulis sp.]|nr:hypothetical protein [Terricaulis sp.]